MATTIGHEKPEGVDEPPAVKKVRLDVDAKEEAKVAEDVKKVTINEGVASESSSPAPGDSTDSAENVKGNVEPSDSNEEGDEAAAGVSEEKQTGKPNVAGSAFGGFAAFSGSSGFSSFASSSSTSGGFGAFASSSSSSSGFGASTTSGAASGGFKTTFSASDSTSTSMSPIASATESESVEQSSERQGKDADKPARLGGFASFQSASTFSSVASSTTATDGFAATTSSDLSGIDAAAAAEKKPEAVVPALTEAELANGEEGETILVEKRAKLFKLVDGDYAEVGIGPLRVLRALDADATDNSAVRFVMRRESYARGPGTKLLVNAGLASCLACVKKTEKALLVSVLEPAAGQEQAFAPTTYLLRFGAPEDLDAVHARLSRYMPSPAK